MQELSSRRLFWSKASVLAIALSLAALSACSSSGPDREDTAEADGSIRGELEAFVATFDDGTAKSEYYLRVDGTENTERKLIFASDPNLASGVRLKVWGAETANEIKVSKFVVDDKGVGSTSQSLIGAPKYPDRTIAWVFVDVGGGAGMLTDAEAERRLFGMNTNPADKSLKQYYLEDSYGMQDISGQVVSPLSYPMSTCDTRGMTTALRSQVSGTFDHYLWYFTTRISACSWSGLASVGRPDAPSRDTWYNGSSSCTVLVQEPGHNFGMAHSSSLRCPGAAFADTPGDCTHSEYGDRYDPMGGGCYHMNAWQKAYQGWFGGCNSVRVGTSGTYSLLPIEQQCDGVQVLQIPMPKERPYTYPAGGGGSGGTVTLRYYYLELRTNNGMFDSALQGTPFVLVHVADDYQTRTERGQHTWLLDMNPATTTGNNSWDGLKAGGTFTDPAGGTSFTVDTISQTGATIRVEIAPGTPSAGPATCMDGTPLQGTGPANCTGTGGVAGTSGTGGMAGTAGTGGVAGTAGTGGEAGTAGTGGVTGGGGSGAEAGTAGVGGTDGQGGTGGTAVTSTTGGGPTAGTAGSGNLDPGDRPQLGLSEDDAGCACRTTPARPSGTLGLLLGLGLFGLIRRRR